MAVPNLTEQVAKRSRDRMIFCVKETDPYGIIQIVLKAFSKQHTLKRVDSD